MEEESCHICGEALVGDDAARCALCGSPFHLAWSVDSPVQNCGVYRFEERSYALVFICTRCAEHQPPPAM